MTFRGHHSKQSLPNASVRYDLSALQIMLERELMSCHYNDWCLRYLLWGQGRRQTLHPIDCVVTAVTASGWMCTRTLEVHVSADKSKLLCKRAYLRGSGAAISQGEQGAWTQYKDKRSRCCEREPRRLAVVTVDKNHTVLSTEPAECEWL